ncbi:E3 ubiquitin-protein ligase SHPRH isoform X2 [Bacillus rossius redtenbacheri]|uniref:E3 ubiquitin-protein ligase SHPRH isoform X2 n=1 Tax=Bacillus rossius redtenbacheri TaxID=93214 RepID=UPI002FDCCFE1
MVKRKQRTPKRVSELNEYVWEGRRLAVAEPEHQDVPENSGNNRKKRTKLGNSIAPVDYVLQSKLSDCLFYLKIVGLGNEISSLFLGTVILNVEASSLPQCTEFWLYVSEEQRKSFLYFEVDDKVHYYTVTQGLDIDFYSALSRKCFTLKFEEFDGEACHVRIRIYLPEPECLRLQQKKVPELQTVIGHFYQIAAPVFDDSRCMINHNVQELYDAVKQFYRDAGDPMNFNVEHEDLKPKLRPYQVQAVSWMLSRESQSPKTEAQEEVHCLYAELRLPDGKLVYYNKCLGHILLQKPVSKPPPTGGILADEMGLGKTVEILALILMNPRKDVPAIEHVKEDDDATVSCVDEISLPANNADDDDAGLSEGPVPESIRVNADAAKEVAVPRVRKPTKCKVSRTRKKTKRKKATAKNGNVAEEREERKQKRKVSQLRQLLQQWYDEVLSGIDRRPVQPAKVSVHCLCGQESPQEARVRCSACATWQHHKCVNYLMGRAERYLCPPCWQKKEPVVSGCSLIVTPNSICNQWVDEIRTHISNTDFKVLVYRGVHGVGFIQPYQLMEYDVVIVTYETLRKELNFDANGSQHKKLRHEKRFVSPPSPLSCVSWWRVCLDEAQMVEGACKAAEMVQRLPSTHRWAITGTPVQKTFQDLYGLLLFLGVDPYCEHMCWQDLLYKPYCLNDRAPLLKVMCQFMWRTQKRDVLQQMGVPEMKEEIIFLHFSPIEEFYYRCQHLSSSTEFRRKLLSTHLDTPFDSMDRQILAKILAPLVQLRQACVHPHAVRRGAVHLIGNKDTMTMEEVLESMIKKTKTDCEEELRKYISSLNGMAGIGLINEKYPETVELYRQVLRTSEEHNFLKTDSLQKIHAMHNLAEVLALHAGSVPPTLRDDKLLEEVKDLETEYISKHETLLAASLRTVKDLGSSVGEVRAGLHGSLDWWWAAALERLAAAGATQELLGLVTLELDCPPWLREKTPVATVSHHLQMWTQSVVKKRKIVLKDLKMLQAVPCLDLVNEALSCHLRVQYKNKTRLCRSCKHESLLKSYESDLFAVSKNQARHALVGEVLVLGQLNQGSWKPNFMELVLRKVLSCARLRGLDSQCIEDGNSCFRWLDLLKKEFKHLRVLWRQLHDKVSAVDELSMSKLRLRLRMEDEPLTSSAKDPHNLRSVQPDSLAKIHVIDPYQLDMYETKLYNESELSLSELKKKTGQFVYLQNLRKENTLGSQPCPICKGELKDKWNVLECGHSFCLECVTTLLNQMSRNRTLVRCPVCRELSDHRNISYVVIDDKCKQGETCEDELSVQGSYSTKVEAIVRRLLALKKQDPFVKALVFSTLAAGDSHITALLLPVHLGSKGLNLTEATHVLLTEPILNPTDELQVLGRMHRIGQTRETTVHRFLIHNTIEERIHLAMQSGVDQWTTGKVTLRKFQQLLVQS